MRIKEILAEGKSHPVICVDVQPAYANFSDISAKCAEIVKFVVNQTGPVLMYINAEKTGTTDDTLNDVTQYWEETVNPNIEYDEDKSGDIVPVTSINWNRFEIIDKGYGYLRSWMDQGITYHTIIKVIRAMYRYKLSSSNQFEDINLNLAELVGPEWKDWMQDDFISVNWINVAKLKKFSGAYLVGGGGNECLKEVELMMNAFNIPYRRIERYVY
jgi:hypothetical protein